MTDSDEARSPAGSRVFQHQATDRTFTAPPVESRAEEVGELLAAAFGEPETVLHEILSDLVHLDVHVVRPTEGRRYWTLFTTGVSDLPMAVPDGLADLGFAELVMKLPATWEVDSLVTTPPADATNRWYWPIYWLKTIGRLPHEYGTWIAQGHTIPNGDPAAPMADGTALCAWLLLPPLQEGAAGQRVVCADGTIVNVYALHALYAEELQLKLDKGMDAILDAFDAASVSEILDPGRPSVAPAKRRRFWRR